MNRMQWLRRPPRRRRGWAVLTAAVAALLGAVAAASAEVDEDALRLTPARVGYVEGDVSFWRPGAGDWEAATVNIPLAAGDALATRDGRVEVQVGPQAFLRVGDQTQVRVKSQEPDFLQLEVSQGTAVLDLRRLPAGHVLQIDTPQAALTVDGDGFYRVDVDADTTRTTVRRAGSASLTPAGGQALQVGTGEAAVVRGGATAQFDLVAAPAFDEWDRWNYARADSFLAAPRSVAVSTDVYGAADLDRYGSWRYVSTYGRVWVPYSVPAGWAPYTAGRWLQDPFYGWSWVDYAPWGWAPFHYGRWVYAGYWAWAPGPVVVTPVYAPALVAFFTPSLSVSIGFGAPYVSWVALGWGEPLLPWWGGVGFAGVPCWYGWGGPRVVNNIVINNGAPVPPPNRINHYRNADVPGGVVGVPKEQFGGRDVQRIRLANLTGRDMKPLPAGVPAAVGGTRPAVPKGGLPDVATRDPAPARFSRGAPAASAGLGGAAAPPKPGTDRVPYERLRAARPVDTTQFSRRSPATTGGAGAVAARAKPAADRAPYERLRAARPVEAARAPAAKPAPVSGTGRTVVSRSAAPPPLRGLAKPATGGVDAYRRVRSAAPAPARAGAAPSDFRRAERAPAPVAKPGVPAPATTASDWNRRPQVPSALPKQRTVASNYQRAPVADFAPVQKAPAMPNLGGLGRAGGSVPAGGAPAGGSGRPNFSR